MRPGAFGRLADVDGRVSWALERPSVMVGAWLAMWGLELAAC
jgi:hypothetical protein